MFGPIKSNRGSSFACRSHSGRMHTRKGLQITRLATSDHAQNHSSPMRVQIPTHAPRYPHTHTQNYPSNGSNYDTRMKKGDDPRAKQQELAKLLGVFRDLSLC